MVEPFPGTTIGENFLERLDAEECCGISAIGGADDSLITVGLNPEDRARARADGRFDLDDEVQFTLSAVQADAVGSLPTFYSGESD